MLDDFLRALDTEQLIIQLVSGSVDLYFVGESGIGARNVEPDEIHGAGEHFIPKEIRAKESTVGIGSVMAVLNGDVREVSKENLVGVVLFAWIIEMAVVLVNLVVPNNALEEQEAVVVFMGPPRSIEENSYVGVDHFIVSDKHERWGEDGFLLVAGCESSGCFFGEGSEELVAEVNELLVVHFPGPYHHHVIAVVMVCVELSNHIFGDVANVLPRS